jgi:DNA-binding response OmpR family regulator/predicted ATPase
MDEVAELELSVCRIDLRRGWVWRGTDGIKLTTRELELLAYLASRPGQSVSRHELLAQVWGYSDTVVSRVCDSCVARLRAKIEADPARPVHLITVHGEGYRLVTAAAQAQAQAQAPAPARSQPSGWALGDRTVELDRLRVVGPEGEVALTSQEGQLLQRLHDAGGAVVGRATLQREIWGHSTETRALDSAIRRLRVKIEPDPSEPRYLLTARGGGAQLLVPQAAAVPAPRTPLVGRAEELAALGAALERSRWVLVTGPGGVGKTRLLRQLVASRAGPMWWADLAQADTASDVLRAVARALSIEPSGDEREQLRHVLARRSGLLVLDNLEQVTNDIAPLLQSWLQSAPGLSLLGTSRVRIGLDGEVVLELSPLPTGDATALFTQRAQAAHPSLQLKLEDDPLLRVLVQRLDGLPLALELAAARVGVLGVQGLLDRLDERLDVLYWPRAEQERHRSLRALLAGSWELLEPQEIEALLLCARFREGFSVEDAEGLLGEDALDSLQALRDQSLVHARGDGRFAIYESIRALADEQRSALPDGGRELDLRWVRWMARLGDRPLLRLLWRRGQEAATRRQRAAADDLERAADVALAWGEVELAARVLLGAKDARRPRGQFGPLLGRIERTLASSALSDMTRAELLYAQAHLVFLLDQEDAALLALERALQLAPSDALELRASCHSLLGSLLPAAARQVPAERSLELAAELYARLGQPDLEAWARARALDRQADPRRRPMFEQVVLAARQTGNLELAGRAVAWLARAEELEGDLGSARHRYLEAFEIFQESGQPLGAVGVGNRLLQVAALTGEHEQLERLLEPLLALLDQVGSPPDEATCWVYRVQAHTLTGDLEAALAAAHRARQALASCDATLWQQGALPLYEAEARWRQGDTALAAALAERARDVFAARAFTQFRPLVDALLATIHASLGRAEEALALADRAVESAGRVTAAESSLCRMRRGQVRAWTGDRDGALADLAEGEAIAARAGLVRPSSAPGQEAARLRALLAAAPSRR